MLFKVINYQEEVGIWFEDKRKHESVEFETKSLLEAVDKLEEIFDRIEETYPRIYGEKTEINRKKYTVVIPATFSRNEITHRFDIIID